MTRVTLKMAQKFTIKRSNWYRSNSLCPDICWQT